MAYQDLSFSAGETLTATKMNQMAANDKALHDGTGIAAGAITADKIDFTTFSDNWLLWATSSIITKPSGEYTICTFTIPKTGTWIFQGVVGGTSSNSTEFAMINIKKNDSTIFQAVSSCIERVDISRYDVPFYSASECNAGDVITFVLSAPTSSTIRSGTTISGNLIY